MAKSKKKKAVTKKRKPVKRVKRKRVAVATRSTRKARKTRKRKPKASRKRQHVVKQVERASVERTLSGRKPRHKRHHKRTKHRRVVMAGTRSRRRSVGKKGGSGLLIGVGLGALALYFLSKPKTPAYPTTYPQLPPLTQTSNYQRNNQTSEILNYALAAGIAADAIASLIDRLNKSNDTEVSNIYDHVATTGDVVYV